jgi:hypothetical protein
MDRSDSPSPSPSPITVESFGGRENESGLCAHVRRSRRVLIRYLVSPLYIDSYRTSYGT